MKAVDNVVKGGGGGGGRSYKASLFVQLFCSSASLKGLHRQQLCSRTSYHYYHFYNVVQFER